MGCVARLDGSPTHEAIELGMAALVNLEHRGAVGADPGTGDGAGILTQLPDRLFRASAPEFMREDRGLPPLGRYAVAMCFLPAAQGRRREIEQRFERVAAEHGLRPLAWRDVPVRPSQAGERARVCAPVIRQLFVAAPAGEYEDALERRLFTVRRLVEQSQCDEFSVPSFSARTIVYKGMLSAPQLAPFYGDLGDSRFESALALVHSRFSTNTFPSWELAHPYRLIAHNGEFNTLQGNVNWMRAREAALRSAAFGRELRRLLPVISAGGSDSAAFDNVLEMLVLAGRSLPHAVMMMVPQAFERRGDLSPELRDFYRHHASLMEPWDGPAAIVFSDGRIVGATLDRNGLRPGRWLETHDGWFVLASEAGVLEVAPDRVRRKGRLRPARLVVADLERGIVSDDGTVEHAIASRRAYGRWCEAATVRLADLSAKPRPAHSGEPLGALQLAFGYSQEDLWVLLGPMADKGKEPDGSMGNDAPAAVLSDRRPSLFSYFKQRFAQVTNPAIDSIREQVVMSLTTAIGPQGNLLEEGPAQVGQIVLDHPVLVDEELEKLRQVSLRGFSAQTLDVTWPVAEGPRGMEAALERLGSQASEAIEREHNLIVLSDRGVCASRVAVPALLATSAVHHHLIRCGTRLQTGLVVESGEPREVHHLAALIGYGAGAVNPYLMLATLEELRGRAALASDIDAAEARRRLLQALDKGLLKVMSKMGISTIQSYRGAQVFEAVGLGRELIDRHFPGTPSRLGGVEIDLLAEEALARHARAYPTAHGRRLPAHVADDLLPAAHGRLLPQGGLYAWRRDGERHMWDPQTIAALQHAVRDAKGPVAYEEFSRRVNEENARRATLRGLLRLRTANRPLALDEVEASERLVRRFSTGGMSLGALSPEAHETLAIAMNRLGGMSNTGEGGEDRRRYARDDRGDSRRSAIKQVASGRFGVTNDYLVNADQLQIKISQGSKPGEGGQLPGHKVDEYIAKLRFSTPGVELISPPPHHDIYSIEDLKQLIYDLRCANPEASVSVKLAAEYGVGTVAAGVAKAGADHVVIAGHDGGTGASPLSSIQSAGVPWELGLAETQQTLLENGLRDRIVVQADGGMRTGRDLVVAGLLGADEVGFATAPLIASGCIMMRVCHANTCPVGIATQDPELRRLFTGRPEHVVDYLLLVAEEARRIMAALGVSRFEELVGRTELLEPDPEVGHRKASSLDLRGLLERPALDRGAARRRTRGPEPVDLEFNRALLRDASAALERGERVSIRRAVSNVDLAVGALLSGEIARRIGPKGLPEDTIEISLEGSAGQSLGAWLAPGVSLRLHGEANDYVGKGMSGGIVAVVPPGKARFAAEQSVIVGNVALYGATGGRAFLRGLAGERFAVRNSGAQAVVEGIGDHGCEYMTGGRVVVLGETGQNFAAGMSGGIAYVLDRSGRFASRVNTELVELEAPDDRDAEELRELIVQHHERTGSPLARGILDRFEQTVAAFVKVMPRDYKRALAQRERDGAQRVTEPVAG